MKIEKGFRINTERLDTGVINTQLNPKMPNQSFKRDRESRTAFERHSLIGFYSFSVYFRSSFPGPLIQRSGLMNNLLPHIIIYVLKANEGGAPWQQHEKE